MDLLCINSEFSQYWVAYFQKYGIQTPVKDNIYTLRKFVNNTKGEKGILLNEIINGEFPKTSPLTGFVGKGEQNWSVKRFVHLDGKPLLEEELRKINQLVN